MGFGVVVEEVRALALNSLEATENIEGQLNVMLRFIEEILKHINDSNSSIINRRVKCTDRGN